MKKFVRIRYNGIPHVGRLDGAVVDVLDHDDPLAAICGQGELLGRVGADADLLPPVEAPEIWCAGVTYEHSRNARVEEARTNARDAYTRVYEADRPELFLKDAGMRRTVGPGDEIRCRSDSRWTVPEPELGIIIGQGGNPVAVTIGNDVSSRDIEGTNPLYLPQAKVFAGACAIGPALAVPDDWGKPFQIRLRINAPDGSELFAGETSTTRLRRSPHELVAWLMRDNPVPPRSVLLTGTGIVPPDDYTLEPGHTVVIEVAGIGTLVNRVAAHPDRT